MRFLLSLLGVVVLRDGSLLVILRSKAQPGEVTLKATSAAFAPLALGLKTQR